MKNTLKIGLVLMATVIAISSSSFAQKKRKPFKGTITYEMKYSGEELEPAQIAQMPKEKTVKIYKNLTLAEQGPATVITNGDLRKVSVLMDLSSYGLEKYLIVQKEEEIEEKRKGAEIKYLDETKKVLGYKTKKAIITIPANEDEDESSTAKITAYYTEDFGSELVNFGDDMFHGLKGIALEFEIITSEITIKCTAISVKKGKVKEVDFLIPTGYTETTMEAFQEEMDALRGGDDE